MVGLSGIQMAFENRTISKSEFQIFFSDEDMESVPQAPFKYLRETFKDTAFRASQYKMLNKLIYTKKLLHICRLVDTNQCERCIIWVLRFLPTIPPLGGGMPSVIWQR